MYVIFLLFYFYFTVKGGKTYVLENYQWSLLSISNFTKTELLIMKIYQPKTVVVVTPAVVNSRLSTRSYPKYRRHIGKCSQEI
jgi:hypothetical protein